MDVEWDQRAAVVTENESTGMLRLTQAHLAINKYIFFLVVEADPHGVTRSWSPLSGVIQDFPVWLLLENNVGDLKRRVRGVSIVGSDSREEIMAS